MGLLKQKVLITVKTYPALSSTYAELVCTAGLTEDGRWIRIYPIPFRRLKDYYQFRKYTWIELPLVKNCKDPRPESYHPANLQEIQVLEPVGTTHQWQRRKEIVFRASIYSNMTALIEKAKKNVLSLAVFKPSKIKDFIWKEDDREWDEAKFRKAVQIFQQKPLFTEEEYKDTFRFAPKLPYKFFYLFEDEEGRESKLMVEDWEAGALFWNCLKKEREEQAALQKVKQKYLDSFQKNDLYFFLGTTRQWHQISPNPFLIVGVFYPPKSAQSESLFS